MFKSFPADSAIAQLLKSFMPEQTIFRQGKPGENMYIVAEGYVRIIYEEENVKHLVGVAGPGEVLGEKAVLREQKSYTRNFSAIAATDVTLLEVNAKTLDLVVATWPDFYLRILRLVEERLQKANELVAILQNANPLERVGNYILYYDRHLCTKLPRGHATISISDIETAANVERTIVEEVIRDLKARKIIYADKAGFILSNEAALLQHLADLREKKAA